VKENPIMKSILERIAEGETLISDGAMGTYLHARGLAAGECPESWCVSHPDVLSEIAESYIAAGSDIIGTNSFGGSSLRLKAGGFADKAQEFNRKAAALAKRAMGNKGYVAASVGPISLFMKGEGGNASEEEMYESFKEQVMALAEGGADAICIETMFSIREATQAIQAAKENTKLPVFCTFTFDPGPRGFFTLTGLTPAGAAVEAFAAGADIVGTNCGNGIANMIEITKEMRAAAPGVPILVHANAGMPKVVDGEAVFGETPEYMASQVGALIQAGANIIGGCCGTLPAHITAMAKAARLIAAKL
jgi:5-methyltetrahydrofolate--homocysteine methyltransferase